MWLNGEDIRFILSYIFTEDVPLPSSVLCLNCNGDCTDITRVYEEGAYLTAIYSGPEERTKTLSFGEFVLGIRRWVAVYWKDLDYDGTGHLLVEELTIRDIRNMLSYLLD